MKFIGDENLDKSLIKYLKENNIDIIYIREYNRGMNDVDIIKKAFKEKRIIITKDKGFGELVFRLKYRIYGLILLRLDEENDYSEYLYSVINKYKDRINNKFVVVTPKSIRIRHL